MYHGQHVLLILVGIVAVVTSYPQGPPVDTHPEICNSMSPTAGHNAQPMTSAAPYEIAVSGDCYSFGSTLKARLRIKNSDDEDSFFEGFFIQARTSGSTISHGKFDHMDAPLMQTLDCTEAAGSDMQPMSPLNNALGHNGARHFLARTFQWTAPSRNVGTIQFVATVVRETDEIWMNVMSEEIAYNSTCSASTDLPDETYADYDDDCVSASHATSSDEVICGAMATSPKNIILLIFSAIAAAFRALKQ